MPELPEVETIVRELRPRVLGKIITGLILKAKALKHIVQLEPEKFYLGVLNQTVVTIVRKGKYIIVPLSNNNILVIHLGMTGKLLLRERAEVDFEEQLTGNEYVDEHTHMLFELTDPSEEEDNLELHFNDVRLFGKIWLIENAKNIEELNSVPGLRELGPDALGISLREFEQLTQSKCAIKTVLLDQSKIAGVGNIYADEACFAAGLHPATPACYLSEEQVLKLWFSIKSVLKRGIKYRGSSTSDYTTTDGSKGSFQNYHRVYRKTGQNCVECGSIIERIKIAGRSTHFCPTCQPKGIK